MKQLTFNTEKNNLSSDDIDQLTLLIGRRCQARTLSRIRSILKYSASTIQSYGIYDRLMKEEGTWSYCAGQSYPEEIRTVRNLILGRST